MKYFGLVLLIISLNGFSQNPSNYQYRTVRERSLAGMFDSGLHVPRYNGVPTGVRTGVSTHSGALGFDSTNNYLYVWDNYTWHKLAMYADLATAGRFGVEDALAGQNRTFTGNNNTYYLAFDSLNYFRVDRDGVTRMYMSSAQTLNQSPDGNTLVNIQNGLTQLSINSADNYMWGRSDSFLVHKRISYEGNIHSTFYPYSLVDKSYVDSVSSASVPGIDDVLAVGQSLTTNRTVTQGSNQLTFTGTATGVVNVQVERTASPLNSTVLSIQRNSSDAPVNNMSAAFDMSVEGDGGGITTTSIRSVLTDKSSGSEDSKLVIQGLSGGATTNILDLQPDGTAIVNSGTDTLATKAYARSVGGGSGGVNAADLPLRITGGTTVSADTSVAYDPSLTTNARTQKIIDSLSSVGAISTGINFQPWYQYYVDPSNNTQAFMYFANSGSGASTTLPSSSIVAGWMSGRQYATGTTSSGKAYGYFGAGSGYTPISFSSSFRYNVGAKVRLEDLSDGTETYQFSFGFSDDANALSTALDGVYFRYTHGDSSGVWIACTESNDVITEDATDVTVAADTDYELEITVFNTEAKFYINKVLKATITTNIPSGTARQTSIVILMHKSAGSTARLAYSEWMAYGKRNY